MDKNTKTISGRVKLSREIKHAIKITSGALDKYEFGYAVKENTEIYGRDLLLGGVIEVEGKEIVEDQKYFMKMPAIYPVNHYRALRRIAEKCRTESEAMTEMKRYVTKLFNRARARMVEENN